MEADWEVEIGPDAPVIDAGWPGFVDLRSAPERALQLQEVRELPALASALQALNASNGSLYTVKCDVWPVEQIDPIEFDAPAEEAAHAIACYIDLLPRNPQRWPEPQLVIAWCKRLCSALRSFSLRCSRIDFIVRTAIVADREDSALGVTSYVAACGSTQDSAKTQLALALKILTDCVQSAESRNAPG